MTDTFWQQALLPRHLRCRRRPVHHLCLPAHLWHLPMEGSLQKPLHRPPSHALSAIGLSVTKRDLCLSTPVVCMLANPLRLLPKRALPPVDGEYAIRTAATRFGSTRSPTAVNANSTRLLGISETAIVCPTSLHVPGLHRRTSLRSPRSSLVTMNRRRCRTRTLSFPNSLMNGLTSFLRRLFFGFRNNSDKRSLAGLLTTSRP